MIESQSFAEEINQNSFESTDNKRILEAVWKNCQFDSVSDIPYYYPCSLNCVAKHQELCDLLNISKIASITSVDSTVFFAYAVT